MYEANEIQEVMGRSYGIGDDIDEAELEAEFDALGELSMIAYHINSTPYGLGYISRNSIPCQIEPKYMILIIAYNTDYISSYFHQKFRR